MSLKNWLLEKAITGKLPLWVYRLIGRRVADKLNLLEGNNMGSDKDIQPWYRQRTKWIAILAAVLASIQPVSTAFGHPVQVPLWVYEFLAGVGLYTLRSAVESTK